MEYRYLGNTGVKVSALCLGCLTFGRETDETTSRQILDRFASAGGNFLDTADVYSLGASEEIVGRWLHDAGHRQQIILATKVFSRMGAGPNDEGLSRKHICDAVEASLRRLHTDYIDLYQVHCWDSRTPLAETLAALDDLVRAGKVRYIGASNFAGWHLMKALATSDAHGWARFISLQPQYSLIVRETEWELIPLCQAEGLAVLPWSPLGSGWLTGKYRSGQEPPEDSRVGRAYKRGDDRWRSRENERTWGILAALDAVAAARGKTQAQVALAWLLAQPVVTSPIIGARTVAQLESNLGCLGWSLSAEELAQLDTASALRLPYPYDFIRNAQRV
ncbi:MAG: aldo/keto reductase [Anaerolineae bacterium]|nr:aldo/keto reductase [Anaerolineae bacterium]